MNPICIPGDRGNTLHVLGTLIVVRIHGRDTNGTLSLRVIHLAELKAAA